MTDNVSWLLETSIKDGELDNIKTLMGEMVGATEANEPGTLNYEWYISEDNASLCVYERYADSAATMVHLGTFGENFAERFMAALEPARLTVFGDPSAEVREALAPFGAAHMAQIGGFAR